MRKSIATVLLDFDSTIISCESLEKMILAKECTKAEIEEIQKLTNEAMSGKKPFYHALEQRLKLVSLTKTDVLTFSQVVCQYLTPGIKELVNDLVEAKVEVWILSGAIRELILPIGQALGISESNIHAVALHWSKDGTYTGIDSQVAFSHSKTAGARELANRWTKPVIAVGDGMTDYALYEEGLATHFIAYTQHARRAQVIAKSTMEARSVEELRECLCSHILNIK